jgi:hypothetical protein
MTFHDWIFYKARKGDNKTEVTFAEFFNTLDFNKQEEYLVRESFQNSGDAALSTADPVRVRIFVSGSERSLPPAVARTYFDSLAPHLHACTDIKGDWAAILQAPCEFLVIEDFNTKGLTGDESADMHDGTPNHFYHFFRTAGRTDKQAGSGKAGSWGVGKFVYIMSSQIRTMFGYTVREHAEASRRQLLLGQSALRYHAIDGDTFSNYGYFGIPTDPQEGVTMPYNDGALIEKFRIDWRIARKDHQTGLSVVMPYCRGIESEDLLFSIVKEYGGRILNGRLEVELDLPGGVMILDKQSLFSVIESYCQNPEWADVRSLLTLLNEKDEASPSDWIVLPRLEKATEWRDLELSDHLRETLTSRFLTRGTVFVRVPVEIHREALPKSESGESSFFEILLHQEEGNEPIAPVFFRDGLRISGKQMGNKSNGVRTVFISGPGILAEMLTNAEGPAHTEWQHNRDKFKGVYRRGDIWLKFCKNAPRRMVELVRGGNEENDYLALADIFPDPDYQAEPTNKPKSKTRGEGGGSSGQVQIDQPGTIPVRINAITGGFTLKLEDETRVSEIQVEMAYARVRGNTFSKWNPADFTASTLRVDVVSGAIVERTQNRIVVTVKSPQKFKLKVTGFDENRDLRVRATDTKAA